MRRIQRIITSSLLCLALGASSAWSEETLEVPPGLEEQARLEVAAQHGLLPEELTFSAVAQLASPFLDEQIYHFKFVGPGEEGIYDVALDPSGMPVDAAANDAQELALYHETFGRVSPELTEILETAPAEDPIDVAIWLEEPSYDGIDRPESSAELTTEEVDAVYAEAEALRRDAVEPLVTVALDRLSLLGVEAEGMELSPLVFASLRPDEIYEVALWDEVGTIESSEPLTPSLSYARASILASPVHQAGRTGGGVKVAVIEPNGRMDSSNPYVSQLLQDSQGVCSTASTHATAMAGILASTHPIHTGIAPAATVRMGGGCAGVPARVMSASRRAITWGARTLSYSFGRDMGLRATALGRTNDDLVRNLFRSIMAAAGNNACFLCSSNIDDPGTAYNVVTVGATDDRNNINRQDDCMWGDSSWRNPLSRSGGREKPDLVAPGVSITSTTHSSPWVGNIGSGTSAATPMVAGTSALLIQSKTTLGLWPEATKAILLATANLNIEGRASRSERDGAGGLDAEEADKVTRREKGDWAGISYRCSSAPRTLEIARLNLSQNRHFRAAIAWDNDPTFGNAYLGVVNGRNLSRPSADLDLIIRGPGGIEINSGSFDNTTEIVDFFPTVAGEYVIEIVRFRCDQDPRWLGWAWWYDS